MLKLSSWSVNSSRNRILKQQIFFYPFFFFGWFWAAKDKQIYPFNFSALFEHQRVNKSIPFLLLAKFVHPILTLFSQRYFMEKNSIILVFCKHLTEKLLYITKNSTKLKIAYLIVNLFIFGYLSSSYLKIFIMVWELLSKQDFKAMSFCFTILSWKTWCRFYESI